MKTVKKTKTKATTKHQDALTMLNKWWAGDKEFKQLVAEAREDLSIAEQIYKLRKEAGLTQAELAALINTQHSAISRLEDAAYGKPSLAMLNRIAEALGKKVKIEFVDKLT